MLTPGLRIVNAVFEASTMLRSVALLLADRRVALFGTLSSPTMMTRSNHVLEVNDADSSINLCEKSSN
jgi:hypothetical protein